ncbi:MAG: hypothetical protein ACPGGB_09165, partial [Flavobacteriales bacterium]
MNFAQDLQHPVFRAVGAEADRKGQQAFAIGGFVRDLLLQRPCKDIDIVVERMKLRAEKEGRRDDADEAVIRNRFKVYDEATAPLLGHYDPRLIVDVDAFGTI